MSSKLSNAADTILNYYETCLARHGDTPEGAGWPNETDRITRFDVALDIMAANRPSHPIVICDLGCGTGDFLRRILHSDVESIGYVGIDRSAKALSHAREKFPGKRFLQLDILTATEDELKSLQCDFLVAIGLFTVKGQVSQAEMWEFMTSVIQRVWPFIRCGLIFNVMSKQVDWEREDLFHVSHDDMARLLHSLAGRRVGFRADYGLYEYMAYALKPETGESSARKAATGASSSYSLPTNQTLENKSSDEIVPVYLPLLPEAHRLLPYLEVLDRTRRYSNHGSLVRSLETRLSKLVGAERQIVVTANTGTSALIGAILGSAGRASAERPLCLCPAYTFVATAAAVEQCGYRPHFIDVDESSWSPDPEQVLKHPALARVGLVVVVAVYGRVVYQKPWLRFQRETGIPVVIDGAAGLERLVEDPARTIESIPVALSFHATKVFATGEGGAVVCDDHGLLTRAAQALNFGFLETRESRAASTNGKMSEYHAAVGLAELDAWQAKLAAFRSVAETYARLAQEHGIGDRLITAPEVASNYVLIKADDAEQAGRIRAMLTAEGIGHRLWYGLGLHREPYFATAPSDALNAVDRLAPCLVGLPMAVDLPVVAVERTISAIRRGVQARVG